MFAKIRSALQKGFKAYAADDGWTFIETLIVLGIILILTATVGFSSVRYLQKAKVVAVRTQLDSYDLALQAYYLDCGCYPSQDQGLAALWEKPQSEPVPENWDGPYLAKAPPKDPWGREFVYLLPGPDGIPYGIASYGLDGIEGGDDENADIASWQ